MLLGMIWRPGSITGTQEAQFGMFPMIIGSILATFGAIVLGVPLSIGTAILLAEAAPQAVRELIRPAIELLAGIPSVVYGLFGMVVLAGLIRIIPVARNSGFGLLNASIILAVMIIPTITNIAEDAIRAVPKDYKEGSLALGATHWQTILNVIIPAARSGIIAAVILGIGRALGETMAVIMVIGNSIALPKPLTDNPLTLFLSTARTLTGNIAVEINYAAGAHRSALFFTGLLLFLMIFLVNSLARYLMREKTA
jgi:phosphate transport system permease protein